MRYVTSFERLAKEEGGLEKTRSLINRTLKLRFGDVPVTIIETIEAVESIKDLEVLHDQAVTTDSLASFVREIPQAEPA